MLRTLDPAISARDEAWLSSPLVRRLTRRAWLTRRCTCRRTHDSCHPPAKPKILQIRTKAFSRNKHPVLMVQVQTMFLNGWFQVSGSSQAVVFQNEIAAMHAANGGVLPAFHADFTHRVPRKSHAIHNPGPVDLSF